MEEALDLSFDRLLMMMIIFFFAKYVSYRIIDQLFCFLPIFGQLKVFEKNSCSDRSAVSNMLTASFSTVLPPICKFLACLIHKEYKCVRK